MDWLWCAPPSCVKVCVSVSVCLFNCVCVRVCVMYVCVTVIDYFRVVSYWLQVEWVGVWQCVCECRKEDLILEVEEQYSYLVYGLSLFLMTTYYSVTLSTNRLVLFCWKFPCWLNDAHSNVSHTFRLPVVMHCTLLLSLALLCQNELTLNNSSNAYITLLCVY